MRRDGLGLSTRVFTEAYRDAAYAIMLDTVEGILKHSKQRGAIEDLTLQLLRGISEGLEEKRKRKRGRSGE